MRDWTPTELPPLETFEEVMHRNGKDWRSCGHRPDSNLSRNDGSVHGAIRPVQPPKLAAGKAVRHTSLE